MQENASVSVIIVNYNTASLITACIESIRKLTVDIDYEIIVVDNASQDNSKAIVTQRFPDVAWIDAEENLGFGKANNLGAKYASGKYLLFLNPDTVLLNNAIKCFLDYAREHENLGALGGWLLDDRGRLNLSGGSFPSPKAEILYLYRKLFPSKQTGDFSDKITDVDFVSGADLFMSRAVFESEGGFDPAIFMYYEETDLQYRLAKRGLARRLIPGPKILHLEGGSFQKKGLSYTRFTMAQKSYNHFIAKHFKGISSEFFFCSLAIIRLLLFFKTTWSLKERISAYKLVLSRNTN